MKSRFRLCVLPLAAYLIAGCGNDPRFTAPPPPAPAFLPLAVGSQWDYAVSRTRQIIFNGDTLAPTVLDLIEERELVGVYLSVVPRFLDDGVTLDWRSDLFVDALTAAVAD